MFSWTADDIQCASEKILQSSRNTDKNAFRARDDSPFAPFLKKVHLERASEQAQRRTFNARVNRLRCERQRPVYGDNLVRLVTAPHVAQVPHLVPVRTRRLRRVATPTTPAPTGAVYEPPVPTDGTQPLRASYPTDPLLEAVLLPNRRGECMQKNIEKFVCLHDTVSAPPVILSCSRPAWASWRRLDDQANALHSWGNRCQTYHNWLTQTRMTFPEKRLIQWDCGKLQRLDLLLRELKAGAHRCLVFTQMTKMLDVLEEFLSMHGYRYLRLDGSTKTDARAKLMERFNTDTSYFCFILTTRSGGLGMNLTGADWPLV
eukprot:TRINITY_DN1732_c0_g1_i6.p1 TRINITY_DN1732_c0_g1~~TRINITY_DN1732_c0_g1_i6.p1  ORF type:complete len:317 (+),score=32.76 TRINITY_DN1732_c0_g1_i6:44-994(+)